MPGEEKTQRRRGLTTGAVRLFGHGPSRTELRPAALPLWGVLGPHTVTAVSGKYELYSTHPGFG